MGYDVDIERLPPSAVIDLQGEASAVAAWCGDGLPPLPAQANSASAGNGLELYWIGRERWLLRAALDREDELLALTRPDEAPLEISAVQVSDTLQFFALRGADAGDIVSIASPLDHHPSVFPRNGVSYTDLFGIKGLIVRRADGFELGVERSFADMIEDYLARANA
jgi:sarcosine oxidase subunit gamma